MLDLDQMTTDGVAVREIATTSGHRIGHVTLNSTATLNALNLPMVKRLASAFDTWADDEGIVAVVLDAAGDKAFCAGGDVASLAREILSLRTESPGTVSPLAEAFFEHEYRLDYRLHTYPKPVVGWGHGIVMGGGIGLLAGCSHRVVTPRTRLAMPEVAIGLYPDVAGSWFLPRMPGKTGLFLALTGASVHAADALFLGLADFVARHEDKAALLAAMAEAPWRGDAERDGARLSHLIEALGTPDELPAAPVRTHLDLINKTMGHDRLADIAPRLRGLADHAEPWLAQAAQGFIKGSPSSAAVSYELLRRARTLSLADALRLEYQVSLGCCLANDFAEGVRALLIDKDKNPRWDPPTLDAVTQAHVNAHFQPRHDGPHPLADLV
ncbi:MAG: enoyl-CoA hydratase/isomerase family protein [Aquincola tertiaricarbonis]